MRRECLWVGRTCGGPGQFQDEDGDLKVDAARAKDEPARELSQTLFIAV